MSVFHTMPLGGEFKIVTLGSDSQNSKATRVLTYNVSTYPGYQNFTVDNFIVDVTNLSIDGNSGVGSFYGGGIGKSYNPSTGIITITKSAVNHSSGWFLSGYGIVVKLAYVG